MVSNGVGEGITSLGRLILTHIGLGILPVFAIPALIPTGTVPGLASTIAALIHLGVAVSRASDVAREAADIILLRSDIEAVPQAIGLARAALRTIKQNLFWAFFYNAAAVPLAALGFLSPLVCAAAMGLSDLMVIGNALRLLRWRG